MKYQKDLQEALVHERPAPDTRPPISRGCIAGREHLSKTPFTDGREFIAPVVSHIAKYGSRVIMSEDARKLEVELLSLKEENERLKEAIVQLFEAIAIMASYKSMFSAVLWAIFNNTVVDKSDRVKEFVK